MKFKILTERLKHLTINEADLSVPATYFFDHFVDSTSLFLQSEPLQNYQDFHHIALSAISTFYGKEATVCSHQLLRVKRTQLVHGICQLSNNQSSVLYLFEDIKTGLAMISTSDNKTNFIRLKATLLTKEAIIPPELSTSLH